LTRQLYNPRVSLLSGFCCDEIFREDSCLCAGGG